MSGSSLELGLRKIIVIRIVVVSIILISGALIYYLSGYRDSSFKLIAVLSVFYFLNLLFLLFETSFRSHKVYFKYSIVLTDIILSSLVIYFTGGISSPFIFLYPLILIFSGMLISRAASYLSLGICVISYIAIAIIQLKTESDLSSFNQIFTSGVLTERYDLVPSYFHLIGFILIAALGGFLAQKIRVAHEQLGLSEESLTILQNLHQNILQSLTSGVVTLDLDEKVISINKSGLDILDIESEDQIVNKKFENFLPDISILELIDQRRNQINYYTPAGKIMILGLAASLLKDESDSTRGYTVIFQDLTEIRNLEERLRSSEKMAILGQLSGGLAHELRNPLSAISGAIEILSAEVAQNDTTYRLSKVATREIERLNLMVEDFLLLTTPANELNISIVDISSILNETLESFKNTVKRSDLDISKSFQNAMLVEADAYKMKQVFWNLLDNSMDAMPQGGKIEVKCFSENGKIKVSIADEGAGIEDEYLAKIFDPFFTTKEIGTGLGLAIVQKVVEGYNGNISVYSKIGKGTEFIVTLPKPLN
ncbi:MAG: two-component system sensor histidine kinase NtrB [Thermodesulfobacteriota bacterium]